MSHVFCSQIAMLLQNKRLLLVIIGEHSSRSRVVSQVRFTSNSWLSVCALIHRDEYDGELEAYDSGLNTN